jgi:hypothetical protein
VSFWLRRDDHDVIPLWQLCSLFSILRFSFSQTWNVKFLKVGSSGYLLLAVIILFKVGGWILKYNSLHFLHTEFLTKSSYFTSLLFLCTALFVSSCKDSPVCPVNFHYKF